MLRRDCLWWWAGAALAGGCASARPGADSAVIEALAPQGKLRGGFLAGPIYAIPDPASGRPRGPAVDMGEALAQRLDVPFEPAPQATIPAVLTGLKEGRFDIVMMGVNAERAAAIDFSPPFLEVEQGVLVRPGLPPSRLDEMDRPGWRVGVLERAGADAVLTRSLKSAQIVRSGSLDTLFVDLAAGRIDMVAATKSRLFTEATKLPGSRLLDGRLLVEPIAMGVVKGKPAAATTYLTRFVEEARSTGLVAAAVARAKLLGVAVPGAH